MKQTKDDIEKNIARLASGLGLIQEALVEQNFILTRLSNVINTIYVEMSNISDMEKILLDVMKKNGWLEKRNRK